MKLFIALLITGISFATNAQNQNATVTSSALTGKPALDLFLAIKDISQNVTPEGSHAHLDPISIELKTTRGLIRCTASQIIKGSQFSAMGTFCTVTRAAQGSNDYSVQRTE